MILNNESNKKKKFEQFFIMTYPKVKAFAWKLLKSEEDAEDIAQDIFAKLWTNPEIWENQETWNSFHTYVPPFHTSATNQAEPSGVASTTIPLLVATIRKYE